MIEHRYFQLLVEFYKRQNKSYPSFKPNEAVDSNLKFDEWNNLFLQQDTVNSLRIIQELINFVKNPNYNPSKAKNSRQSFSMFSSNEDEREPIKTAFVGYLYSNPFSVKDPYSWSGEVLAWIEKFEKWFKEKEAANQIGCLEGQTSPKTNDQKTSNPKQETIDNFDWINEYWLKELMFFYRDNLDFFKAQFDNPKAFQEWFEKQKDKQLPGFFAGTAIILNKLMSEKYVSPLESHQQLAHIEYLHKKKNELIEKSLLTNLSEDEKKAIQKGLEYCERKLQQANHLIDQGQSMPLSSREALAFGLYKKALEKFDTNPRFLANLLSEEITLSPRDENSLFNLAGVDLKGKASLGEYIYQLMTTIKDKNGKEQDKILQGIIRAWRKGTQFCDNLNHHYREEVSNSFKASVNDLVLEERIKNELTKKLYLQLKQLPLSSEEYQTLVQKQLTNLNYLAIQLVKAYSNTHFISTELSTELFKINLKEDDYFSIVNKIISTASTSEKDPNAPATMEKPSANPRALRRVKTVVIKELVEAAEQSSPSNDKPDSQEVPKANSINDNEFQPQASEKSITDEPQAKIVAENVITESKVEATELLKASEQPSSSKDKSHYREISKVNSINHKEFLTEVAEENVNMAPQVEAIENQVATDEDSYDKIPADKAQNKPKIHYFNTPKEITPAYYEYKTNAYHYVQSILIPLINNDKKKISDHKVEKVMDNLINQLKHLNSTNDTVQRVNKKGKPSTSLKSSNKSGKKAGYEFYLKKPLKRSKGYKKSSNTSYEFYLEKPIKYTDEPTKNKDYDFFVHRFLSDAIEQVLSKKNEFSKNSFLNLIKYLNKYALALSKLDSRETNLQQTLLINLTDCMEREPSSEKSLGIFIYMQSLREKQNYVFEDIDWLNEIKDELIALQKASETQSRFFTKHSGTKEIIKRCIDLVKKEINNLTHKNDFDHRKKELLNELHDKLLNHFLPLQNVSEDTLEKTNNKDANPNQFGFIERAKIQEEIKVALSEIFTYIDLIDQLSEKSDIDIKDLIDIQSEFVSLGECIQLDNKENSSEIQIAFKQAHEDIEKTIIEFEFFDLAQHHKQISFS